MNKDERIEPGMVFGKLTVVEAYTRKSLNGHSYHKCICECGNYKEVQRGGLLTGSTSSCGCVRRESTSRSFKSHGKSGSEEYIVWKNMRSRCNNINNDRYSSYGGRGICVCEEWNDSFEQFYLDMGPKPFPGAEIDRIEVDKGYEKENCRWVSKKEQQLNKQRTKYIEFLGIKAPLMTWCRDLGVPYYTILARIEKLGWEVEKAFTIGIGERSVY